MNLSDNIDLPIKKAVAGMALLGFTPIMSCCGFSYEGEYKKSHLGNKPYIYLYRNFDNDQLLLAKLSRLSILSEWQFRAYNFFIDFHGQRFGKDHPWGHPESFHSYEMPLISIKGLLDAIKSMKADFRPCVLKDGNEIWAKRLNTQFWQAKPAQPWVISPEDYDSLPE
jgi:hypothetical protein